MIRFRAVFSAIALLPGIFAGAQLPPGFQMPSLWYNPALVMDPGVQKELKVSAAVANKIQTAIIAEAMKVGPAAMSMMGGKAPSQAQASRSNPALASSLSKMQRACTDNLNPTQLQRLHEITLQAFGPMAMLDPKIGTQVGLTPTQEMKLQAELGKLAAVQRAEVGKMYSSAMRDPKALEAMTASSRAKKEVLLSSILTPKQRSKWKALQGKPYHFSGLAALMGGG